MRKRSAQEIQRQSHWQEIVRGQQQSGQSVRAYCRQAGIEESAFYWWRRELARRAGRARIVAHHDAVRPRASRGDRSRERRRRSPPGFFPYR